MKKYLSFFRLRFNTGLQYRAAALAGIVTQFFWGCLLYTSFTGRILDIQGSSQASIDKITVDWERMYRMYCSGDGLGPSEEEEKDEDC